MDSTTKSYGYDDKQKNTNSDTSLKNDINDVKDSITKTAKHASEKAGEVYNDFKDQTSDFQVTALNYVKANPAKSVGYAVLAGFLTAILLRK